MMRIYTLILCLVCSIAEISAVAAQNTVKVIGSGQVFIVPDKLTFIVYLKEKGQSVSKLYASVNQNTSLVISILDKEKVPDKDIQSMAIQVQPWFEYENQRRVQKGFEISRSVSVTLNDTKRLGALLDYLFRIANIEISGIRLLVSNKEQHYLSAISKAIESAKLKAKQISSELSLTLGNAVSVHELNSQVYGQTEASLSTRSVDNSGIFLPGEVSVAASVEVEFAIE